MTQTEEEFGTLADAATLERTAEALVKNGMNVIIAENSNKAKEKLFELLPEGAEVMNMTSATLDAIGASEEIVDSGRYNSVRKQFSSMDPKKDGRVMRQLGAAPDWVVGSVHAITRDGTVLIASATGSQLPGYAYGGGRVIWVVGTQKLVGTFEDGMRRIQEYTFPREDARAQKAYGVHSSINKVLIVHKEATPGRITVILVKENLGF